MTTRPVRMAILGGFALFAVSYLPLQMHDQEPEGLVPLMSSPLGLIHRSARAQEAGSEFGPSNVYQLVSDLQAGDRGLAGGNGRYRLPHRGRAGGRPLPHSRLRAHARAAEKDLGRPEATRDEPCAGRADSGQGDRAAGRPYQCTGGHGGRSVGSRISSSSRTRSFPRPLSAERRLPWSISTWAMRRS